VRIIGADGVTRQYSLASYLRFLEQDRYGRAPTPGLTGSIGYDLGPGRWERLRRFREVPLADADELETEDDDDDEEGDE
jgi:hypothetical protein